jgi:hypothetical protein
MQRLISWLGRIPMWVWLFLALTQVLTLVIVPYRLSELNQMLLETPDRPELADFQNHLQKSWRDDRFQLASAAVLAPLFLGLGWWRWSQNRSEKSAKSASSGQT